MKINAQKEGKSLVSQNLKNLFFALFPVGLCLSFRSIARRSNLVKSLGFSRAIRSKIRLTNAK